MIEAHITCCNPCDIPDLGIVGLRRGEERWVSDSAALASKDLAKEQAKGNIRVNRKTRMSLNPKRPAPKRPAPPFVIQSRPQLQERQEPQSKETVTVVKEVDTQKLKAELLEDLLPSLRSAIAEEMGKIASQRAPTEPAVGMGSAQLEAALENVLRRTGVTGGSSTSGAARVSSGIEEPLFIPDKIVAKDAKAKIDVKQSATESGGDLDDAQEALRALKRQNKEQQ